MVGIDAMTDFYDVTHKEANLASLTAWDSFAFHRADLLDAPLRQLLDSEHPGHGMLDVLLGGILGLVAGIAIAGAIEVGRPSLVGAAAMSRAIGAPLLGEMNTPPDGWTLAALPMPVRTSNSPLNPSRWRR